MFNRCRIGVKKASVLVLSSFLLAVASQQSLAAGPAKIKWIRTCGSYDWQHSAWVIGLSNGITLYGSNNPTQSRAATFSLIQSAHATGQNIYWENAIASTAVVCGVATNFLLDPTYQNTATLMVGDP